MEIIRKSIAAGVLIGMASGLYLNLYQYNQVAAACLFSFALFFICLLGLDLFTGKIGWISRDSLPLWYYPAILAGNLVGTLLAACMLLAGNPDLRQIANTIMEAKSAKSMWALFFNGILCGVMMYLAVVCFKRNKDKGITAYAGIFLAIPVFILAGFEHSIADAGYMFLAMRLDFLLPLLVIVLGNAAGSIGACFFMESPWKLDRPAHNS